MLCALLLRWGESKVPLTPTRAHLQCVSRQGMLICALCCCVRCAFVCALCVCLRVRCLCCFVVSLPFSSTHAHSHAHLSSPADAHVRAVAKLRNEG